jgi:hypothetical protein
MKIILDKYKLTCKDDPRCKVSNWWAFIQGKFRYKIYYSEFFKWLMRDFIREQIAWRISVMDRECYTKGSCKICGCDTTALQMADKPCPKPCYPEMMSKKAWERIKKVKNIKNL